MEPQSVMLWLSIESGMGISAIHRDQLLMGTQAISSTLLMPGACVCNNILILLWILVAAT
jgi:hypothetical protein